MYLNYFCKVLYKNYKFYTPCTVELQLNESRGLQKIIHNLLLYLFSYLMRNLSIQKNIESKAIKITAVKCSNLNLAKDQVKILYFEKR